MIIDGNIELVKDNPVWCSFCKKYFDRKDLKHFIISDMEGLACEGCIKELKIKEDELV